MAQSDEVYFANRPETPPQDIFSDKHNIIVKKESFTDKLNRIKSDGHKVGVVYRVTTSYEHKKSSNSEKPDMIKLKPEEFVDANEFTSLVEDFTSKLNKDFDTDVFEIVDHSKFPSRVGAFDEIEDNFDDTKYKMLFFYTISCNYKSHFSYTDGKRYLKARADIVARLYAEEAKMGKKRVTYSTRVAGYGLGSVNNSYSAETSLSDNKIYSLDELNTKMDVLPYSKVKDKIQNEQNESLQKFISRKKKK